MDDTQQAQPRAITELVIDAIAKSQMPDGSELDRRLLTETLRELVKLAKVEKLIDIKLDAMAAMGLKDAGQSVIETTMARTLESFKLQLGVPHPPPVPDAAPE